ncbi:MAG: 50S ribosomal protein L5 [Candidatus Bipolaricaulota bacterium]|nr:50S ribosomal protein L5 [Candidatus Bipolaricaulota bacterium]
MLYERYRKEIVPRLMRELGYRNVMEVPRVEKVVINMGVGKHDDPKVLEGAVKNLAQIAGQKPVVTRAKRAISDFKIREGDAIGCMVTLRGPRAYEFLYKLFHVALPGIRDFKGVSPDAFDGRGNFSIGLPEQLVFPEVSYDDVVRPQGMDITVVTTARTDREGRALLEALGCAFRKG